jgi:hypothetical protein
MLSVTWEVRDHRKVTRLSVCEWLWASLPQRPSARRTTKRIMELASIRDMGWVDFFLISFIDSH